MDYRARKRKRQSTSIPTQASFYVNNLPGLKSPSRLSIFSGHLPADDSSISDAHLFFLLSRNIHIAKKERLLIFLNGGPGCSSMDGAFIENIGPLRIDQYGKVQIVEEGSWNEYANVLFLDQPAGSGFSYVTSVKGKEPLRELAQAADQVVVFLANFYKVFPEFANMDTYIAGESFAGQSIPYIADAMSKTTLVSTKLKGLIIGNGWINPREQYPAYLDYLLERKLVKAGSKGAKNIAAAVKKCQDEITRLDKESDGTGKGTVLIPICEEVWAPVIESTKNKAGLCMNLYDTTKYHVCETEWPPTIPQVMKYLRQSSVVKALHAEASVAGWSHCSPIVGANFLTLESIPSVTLLPKLLETIPILLYAGAHDMVVSGLSVQRMIAKLEWNGAIGFNGSKPSDWTVDSKLAGQWTTDRGLSYVHVLNASHMVPMDVPLAAHDMIIRFMQVDTLNAAGASALVPSRIGKVETEVILGATQPDGSALEKAIVEEKKVPLSIDGFDKEHELLYGPRRTILLFAFLSGFILLFWGICSWKRGRRRSRFRARKVKGRANSGVQLDSSSYQMSYSEDSNPFADHGRSNAFGLDEEVGEEEEEESEEESNLFEEGDMGRS